MSAFAKLVGFISSKKETEAIQFLHGLNWNLPNTLDETNTSILMMACKHNCEVLALFLLDGFEFKGNHLNLFQVSDNKYTALTYACQNKLSVVIVKIIDLLQTHNRTDLVAIPNNETFFYKII